MAGIDKEVKIGQGGRCLFLQWFTKKGSLDKIKTEMMCEIQGKIGEISCELEKLNREGRFTFLEAHPTDSCLRL